MNPARATSPSYFLRPSWHAVQSFFWRYPDWWLAALSATAWIGIFAGAATHAGHHAHAPLPFAQELSNWLVMVLAMMVPFLLPMFRAAAVSSIWPRRHRAIALALVAYLAPWLAIGIAAAFIRTFPITHSPLVPALTFAAAALYISTPLHARALVRCHKRTPLAPDGWRADRDCLRYGATIGKACCTGCWPLMLACALSGHSLIAMITGSAIAYLERRGLRPHPRPAMNLTFALAAFFLVQSFLD